MSRFQLNCFSDGWAREKSFEFPLPLTSIPLAEVQLIAAIYLSSRRKGRRVSDDVKYKVRRHVQHLEPSVRI